MESIKGNPAAYEAIGRGFVRVLQRVIRSPADGHVVHDRSPEGRVDALLYDLGDDGSDHPGPLSARQRWAAERRRRFGTALGSRLIEMRRTVREAAETMPPREPPQADPEHLAMWDAAFAQAHARIEEESVVMGRPGRPPVATPTGHKVTLSFRTTSENKSRLVAAAEGERNLSEELERRVDATFRDEDALAQAMALAYGEDNGGLVHLLGEVLRILAPHGEWLDPASPASDPTEPTEP